MDIMSDEPADTDSNEPQLQALEALRQILPGRIFCDEVNRMRAFDNLRLSVLPDVVIKVEEAQEVRRFCSWHMPMVPVTVRGAGGSARFSSPYSTRMGTRFGGIERLGSGSCGRIAQVGGVVTGVASSRRGDGPLLSAGSFFEEILTIGGNVACNAGGMRCVKYGVTRDYVLGLHGFLADGSPFDFGLPLKVCFGAQCARPLDWL